MKFVVDRIEENFVVCENCETGEIINFNKDIFLEEIKSGVLFEFIDGVVNILSNEETHERIKEKMNNLWK